jgi:3-dehydroquinate dehydratase
MRDLTFGHAVRTAATAPPRWRSHSIISPAVKGTVQGLGPQSCLAGLRGLVEMVRDARA